MDEAAQLKQLEEDKKNFKEEQKKAKAEAKAAKKEAKKRARELAEEEDRLGEDDSGSFPVIITTIVIVLVWLAIIAALIKLDVGGFGSGILAPILKDVPVVNQILPDENTGVVTEETMLEEETGFKNVREAAAEVKRLQDELMNVEANSASKDEQISALKEEVDRLQSFEDKQVEFERIKNQFYNEVVYSDNGPGLDEYMKYYESMDPATAEALYKQVAEEQKINKEVEDYAKTYSEMKPKQAAALFESMTDDLDLVSKILLQMDSDTRGQILGAMNTEVAARLTKLMEPDSF